VAQLLKLKILFIFIQKKIMYMNYEDKLFIIINILRLKQISI